MRLCSIVVLFACATTHPTSAPPSVADRDLAVLKGKVMSADYRGDLTELAKLRDELAPYERDPDTGYLAYYWSGFAGWRLAMNGLNHDMAEDELRRHLLRAVADMYAAIRLRDEFADAYAAAAGLNGWLIGSMLRTNDDPDRITEHAALALALLGRAKALAPDNPRVLWIEGGFQLVRGGQPAALATFSRMSAITERSHADPTSPLPDWGRAEALMMAANAHLAGKPPEIAAAREAARAALAIEPDWAYVRDVLIPKIDATQP